MPLEALARGLSRRSREPRPYCFGGLTYRCSSPSASGAMKRSPLPQLRVIGADGEQVGVMTRYEALQMATAQELDLVEVSPTAEPPVCRIIDFGKFLFEQNKKAHSAKRKQKQIQIKEVKFRPGTDEGDYQIKLRNLIRFLTEGDKAKVTLTFPWPRNGAHGHRTPAPDAAAAGPRSRHARGRAAAADGRPADGDDDRAKKEVRELGPHGRSSHRPKRRRAGHSVRHRERAK